MPWSERKVSARFYLFEDLFWRMPNFAPLKQLRSISDLQLLAGLVWAGEQGRGKCPIIRTRCYHKKGVSYFMAGDVGKPGTIHLLPKHRHVAGLLHELAHALGHNDKLSHGPAFRKRCFRLYKTYGEWSGQVE